MFMTYDNKIYFGKVFYLYGKIYHSFCSDIFKWHSCSEIWVCDDIYSCKLFGINYLQIKLKKLNGQSRLLEFILKEGYLFYSYQLVKILLFLLYFKELFCSILILSKDTYKHLNNFFHIFLPKNFRIFQLFDDVFLTLYQF